MINLVYYDPVTGAIRGSLTVCAGPETEAQVAAAAVNAIQTDTPLLPLMAKSMKVDLATKKLTGTMPAGIGSLAPMLRRPAAQPVPVAAPEPKS